MKQTGITRPIPPQGHIRDKKCWENTLRSAKLPGRRRPVWKGLESTVPPEKETLQSAELPAGDEGLARRPALVSCHPC